MRVMSIRIDDDKRRILKVLASIEGRSMSNLVAQLITEYAEERSRQLARDGTRSELQALMTVSEASFTEWDNDEDAIYDRL